MRRIVLVVSVASALLASAVQAADPVVSVRGLRIVGEGYGEEMMMRPFNWFGGTVVAVLIVSEDGGYIDIDDEASTLTRFTDDKGTDLLVGEDQFGRNGISGTVSDDGKAVMVEITGSSLPAKGATAIHAVGKVALTHATVKKEVAHAGVTLKAGTAVKSAALPFKVIKTGKPEWGDEPLEVELEFNQSTDALASVKFLDAQGNTIESSDGGSFTMSGMGSMTVQRSYRLAQEVNSATIVFEVWTDMKKIEVPIDVKASVGF